MAQLFDRARGYTGVLALVTASACSSPTPHAPAADTSLIREPTAASPELQSKAQHAPPPTPAAWSDGHEITSNAGTYRVIYRSSPVSIPRGEIYALDVWVFDARDVNHPLTDVVLMVDAEMPEHQHGMNRRPVVRASDSGGFRVEGLLFHMPGRWELYFDVTRGAITERAQVNVELL